MSIFDSGIRAKDMNGMKFKIDEDESGGSEKLESKVGTDIIK